MLNVKLSILVFLSVKIALLPQSAEFYINSAKKVYPNFDKSIEYLNKAVFAEFKNNDIKFLLHKLKLSSGSKLYLNEINTLMWREEQAGKASPYFYSWQQLAEMSSHDYLNLIYNTVQPIEKAYNLDGKNEDILNMYLRCRLLKNTKIEKEALDKLISFSEQNDKSFNTLVTCLELSLNNQQFREKKNEIMDALVNLDKKSIDKNFIQTNPFHKNSTPQIIGILKKETELRKIPTNFPYKYYLISKIYEYETERLRLAKSYLDKKTLKEIKFDISINHLNAFYHLGYYQTIISLTPKATFKSEFETLRANMILGLTYQKLGLYSKAAQLFIKASSSKEVTNLEPAFNAIKSLVKSNNFAQAKSFIEKYNLKNTPLEVTQKILNTYHKSTLQEYVDLVNLYIRLKGNSLKSSISLLEELGKASIYINNLPEAVKTPKETTSFEFFIKTMLIQADLDFKNKKFKDSLNQISAIKEHSSCDIDIELLECRHFFKNKKLQEANSSINQLFSMSPSHAEIIILKGIIQLEQNDFKGAYKTFETLANQETANYYKLIPLICLNKFDFVEQACKKLVQAKSDYRTLILLHMLWEKNDKATADKFLQNTLAKLQMYPAKCYAEYKLGKITFEEYKKRQDFGPLFGPKFNFAIGFEAM
ncbi:MAG: hypothetical protein NE328_22235 [Lentisphaeraceae bacterium]|nr:hypothetical protein [Lentisphaeraceae bacterium]